MELFQSTIVSGSTATISVRPTGTRPWRVSQVSVEMTAGTAASVAGSATGVLRKNGRLVAPFVAQGDAIAGDPPVDLQMTDTMTIEWSSGLPGNICSALIFYDLVD